MLNQTLKIVEKHSITSEPSLKEFHQRKQQAHFDRLWLIEPEKLDPLRDCMERERIQRTLDLILSLGSLRGKKVVDLGCGNGILAKKMRDAGAQVDAVDVSINALKLLKQGNIENIQPIREYVPMTTLSDNAYDLVLSTELIADLPQEEYRLYVSELSRLVKKTGHVICSTSLDIHSEDALLRFASLAETEFNITAWTFSHHLCFIHLIDFFKAPSRFVKASQDPHYRQQALCRRQGPSQSWFRINSTKIPSLFWKWLQCPSDHIIRRIQQNRSLLIFLEKICSFLWPDAGISHALFLGQRRPIMEAPAIDRKQPDVQARKKILWE